MLNAMAHASNRFFIEVSVVVMGSLDDSAIFMAMRDFVRIYAAWKPLRLGASINRQETSMFMISLLLFIAGAAALFVGFKRNHRAILSLAAVLWLASGTWSDLSDGFKAGFRDGAISQASAR
jgi:hypothetical protein